MCAQGREEPIGKERMIPNIQLHIGGSADHQTILLTNALNRRKMVTSTTVSRQRKRTPGKIKLLFVLAIVMAVWSIVAMRKQTGSFFTIGEIFGMKFWI